MEYLEEKFPIEVSKTKVSSLWERGGGCQHCGESVVISDSKGHRKNAIFVTMPTEASSCGKHALVPVSPGDYVISVIRYRGIVHVEVSKILTVPSVSGEFVEFDEFELYDFETNTYNSREEFERYGISEMFDAVQTAVKKAFTYHCKEAMFISNPKKWVDYARSIAPEAK